MPRFSLRTLIIVMLLGGPVLAGAWWMWQRVPWNARLLVIGISPVAVAYAAVALLYMVEGIKPRLTQLRKIAEKDYAFKDSKRFGHPATHTKPK